MIDEERVKDQISVELTYLRALHRISQGKLAELSGVSKKTLERLERKNYTFLPSLGSLVAICNVFGISLCDLLESRIEGGNDMEIENLKTLPEIKEELSNYNRQSECLLKEYKMLETITEKGPSNMNEFRYINAKKEELAKHRNQLEKDYMEVVAQLEVYRSKYRNNYMDDSENNNKKGEDEDEN